MKKHSLFLLLFFVGMTVSILATKPLKLVNGASNSNKQRLLLHKTQDQKKATAAIEQKLVLAEKNKKWSSYDTLKIVAEIVVTSSFTVAVCSQLPRVFVAL